MPIADIGDELLTIPPADSAAPAPAFLADPPPPLDGFPADEFRARRDSLRAAFPDSVVVIRGSREDEFSGSNVFKQNSSFFYLTGVETPGGYLVLLPDSVPARTGLRETPIDVTEILFLPARNAATSLLRFALLLVELPLRFAQAGLVL